MQSQVIAESFTVTQQDVLYVATQINRDLTALSQAYPDKLSIVDVSNLFSAYSHFLVNNAVSHLGFSIYNPRAHNRVYHEFRYEVLYGGDVQRYNPTGRSLGQGGASVKRVQGVPSSAKFIPWVCWSARMLNLSIREQENIVSGTDWEIPSRSSIFDGQYKGGSWSSRGFYGRGSIGVNGSIYS